jgi:hypothetical protein
METDASSPTMELTHNHGRIEPYDKGDGYIHVPLTGTTTRSLSSRIRTVTR